MCCLCIQVTHENTSECTILHLVNNKILAPPLLPGLVACTVKKASYAPAWADIFRIPECELTKIEELSLN
jgi:hypothetical protein